MSWLCRIGLHRWALLWVTDEVWPLHYGHAVMVCARCGHTRRT